MQSPCHEVPSPAPLAIRARAVSSRSECQVVPKIVHPTCALKLCKKVSLGARGSPPPLAAANQFTPTIVLQPNSRFTRPPCSDWHVESHSLMVFGAAGSS